jgi:general secretion pathway protein B
VSYILDALRRADAERVRGAVPGIHAQQVPAHAAGPHRGPAPWVWMAGGAGLLLVVMLAWQLTGDDEPAPAPVASLPPPLPLPLPPAPVQRAPATVSLPPIVAEPERPRAAPPRAEASRAPASAPAAAAEARIPSLQELPENIRRQIPAMSVGGSIYSENAASRFLIINGQVFHEGNKITPDLVLEQIKLKAAVLRFKGQRFSMSF